MDLKDAILAKEKGSRIDESSIMKIVREYTDGKISEKMMARLLEAIKEHGMEFEETLALTKAIVSTGDIIDLSGVKPPRVDKHSTGGVGDKTTLIVGSLVAATGMHMAKMSGRELGHTGGTLDKLTSIPGVSVEMSKSKFIDQVNKVGLAVISQSEDLVPADKKIYALRDETNTIDSIPLIASSVMSKKIASGADYVVLDVKVGSGAFMKEFGEARDLARVCVDIGNAVGLKTVALISNMKQPLGHAVGNILEVREAIDTLKGQGPRDTTELSFEIVSQLLLMTGEAINKGDARGLLSAELSSDRALEKFGDFISAQGGDRSIIQNPEILPKANLVESLAARSHGLVSEINTEKVGWLAKEIFGLDFQKKIGDEVRIGDELVHIHADSYDQIRNVQRGLEEAITISNQAVSEPLVYSVIR